MSKILLTLFLIPSIVYADKFIYDGISVGMNINQVLQANYNNCEADPKMGTHWISCSSSKNFFPQFKGINIDDVEIELANGTTVFAINLITSNNVTPSDLAQKVDGTITNKSNMTLISIKNHSDSLVIIKGKIAIMNNQRN
jgi:hypothetical protein